jgi:hypothetical protein
MADFPTAVQPPGAASYSAPLLNFSNFANWGNDYNQSVQAGQQQQLNQQKIQQGQQQADLAKAFPNGLPIDPKTGVYDYPAIAQTMAKFGDVPGAMNVMQQQPPQMSPMYGGQGQGGPQPQGQGSPQPGPQPTSIPARPLPPPAANAPQGDSGNGGSITDIVTKRLPDQNQTTGQTIAKIAQMMGLDPNADLTPGQQKRAAGLLNKYAPEIAGTSPSFKDRFAAAGGGDAASLPPSANAGTPSAMPAGNPGATAGRTGAPVSPSGGSGAPVPAQAGQQQGAPQQPQGPVTPQVSLPPGFNDPEKAIQALRTEAVRLGQIPNGQTQAQGLNSWADRIQESIKPISVGASTTIIDPRTGKPIYQGPAAQAYGAMAGGASGTTLDLGAETYYQTGKLPPNTGRGVQGAAVAQAYMARAAELHPDDPLEGWPARWQKFTARGAGAAAEERAVGQRAGAIAIAVDEASKTIPNVRSLAEKSAGKGVATWNSVENKWAVEKGDRDFAKYVQQMNSLINVYGRVISGGGKGTVSDLEHARQMLNPNMPLSAVQGSLEGFETEVGIAEAAPGEVRAKMRGGSAASSQGTSTSSPATSASKKTTNTTPGGLSWSVE